MRVGDSVYNKNIYFINYYKKIERSEKSMSNYYYNKDLFEVIDTEEKAYWLGFLYADGCINRYYKNEKLKSMSLEIGLSIKDENHLKKFLYLLQSNIEIKRKQSKINNTIYESSKITVCCKKMCNDLIKLGCTPKKSLTLTFPNEKQVPKELVKHFIRGYFDGDGCINKRKESNTLRIVIIGTYNFVNEIKNIFIENKVLRSNPSISKKGNAYQLTIHGVDNIKDIYNFMYKNATVYLDRKYIKFNEYIKDIDKNRQNKDSNKRGVYFDKRINKWIATIYINKKRLTLGSFKDLDEAIEIRKEYEIKKMNAENK